MPEEVLGPLFEPPSEIAILPMAIVVLAGCAIALALIGLVRGRVLSDRAFSGAYATGLLMLPAFTYLLGNLYVLGESKQAEFCGSCHSTMSPLLESLSADTDTLAAVHYQHGYVNQKEACYQCHSGFGTYGTVNAKLSGIVHMIKTVTGNYEYPLQLRGEFDLNSCLSCHATALSFRRQEAHRDPDLQQQILSGEIGCTGLCHPTAHPPEALQGVASR